MFFMPRLRPDDGSRCDSDGN